LAEYDLLMNILRIDVGDSKIVLVVAILYFTYLNKVRAVKDNLYLEKERLEKKTSKDKLKLRQAFATEISNINQRHRKALLRLKELHKVEVTKLSVKLQMGACKGDTRHCRYQTYFRQSIALTAHIEVVKGSIVEKFARRLQEAVESEEVKMQSGDVGTILSCHSVLIDSSFQQGISKLLDVLHDEIIPDRGTTKRERFVMEKANEFLARVWRYYGSNYHKSIFLLPFEGRQEKFNERRSEFLEEFRVFFEIVEDIRENPYGKNKQE